MITTCWKYAQLQVTVSRMSADILSPDFFCGFLFDDELRRPLVKPNPGHERDFLAHLTLQLGQSSAVSHWEGLIRPAHGKDELPIRLLADGPGLPASRHSRVRRKAPAMAPAAHMLMSPYRALRRAIS